MESDLDALIQAKQYELRAALTAHRNAHEAVVNARARVAELVREAGPDCMRLAHAVKEELKRLESEERAVVTQFKAISEELAQMHRDKFG